MEKKPTTAALWPLAALTLFAAALFAFYSPGKAVWVDEASSLQIAMSDWPQQLHLLRTDNGNPPFYTLLLGLWLKIFGIGEGAAAGLSGLFYLLSAWAVYRAGKALYDRGTGLTCGFLYLASALAIHHAQNIRMYSLLGFLGIVSTLFFFRLVRDGGQDAKAHSALYVAVNIVGTFTHYWFFFVLFSQGVCRILLHRRPPLLRFVLLGLLSVVPFALLWLPSLLAQMENGSAGWMKSPHLFRTFIDTLLDFYGSIDFHGGILAWPLYALAALAATIRFSEGRIGLRKLTDLMAFARDRRTLSFGVILIVSLYVPLLISQVKPLYVTGRYTIIALFPFVMILGASWPGSPTGGCSSFWAMPW